MTRTCRFLHTECASLLLAPRHISVSGDRQITSFCLFMLSDKHRRFSLLSQCRSLAFFHKKGLSEPVTDLLAATLRHVTALPSLLLPGFEEFMRTTPRAFPAFAALSNIYHLELGARGGFGNFSYAKLLKTMRAPLKVITLSIPSFERKHLRHVTYSRNQDPLWLFSSFAATLESFDVDGRVTVEACSKVHVYPRLTRLTVSSRCAPLIHPYIDAFPSLRDLRFDYTSFQWSTDAMPTHSLPIDTLRGKSSGDLRRRNREDQFDHGSWSALEYFMGMTLDAYMAGITCPIANLHLIGWGGTMEGEVEAICSVFADARPSLFRLALRPPHIDNGYLDALFSQRVETFSSLSSLELRLDVTVVPFDFGLYLVRLSIMTFLRRLLMHQAGDHRRSAPIAPYTLLASGDQMHSAICSNPS